MPNASRMEGQRIESAPSRRNEASEAGVGLNSAVRGNQSPMSARTHCPNCHAPLKVPDAAVGRRLKCPKCATKFVPDLEVGGTASRGGASGSVTGMPEAGPASASSPAMRPADDDLIMPTVTRDFREAFDLPLLKDDDEIDRVVAPRGEASAASLLNEPSRPRAKKPVGGDARRQARRCECGSVVPAGMSLCTRCGLDLDTGMRIGVDDLLEETVAPPRMPGVPMGVIFVGVTTTLISVMLTLTALYFYFAPRYSERSWGFLLLAMVASFGVYASVRFIQGRSMRLLLSALLLGGALDLIGLVVWPIVQADLNAEPVASGEREVEAPPDHATLPPTYEPRPDLVASEIEIAGSEIKPLTERIEWRRVYTGLIVLIVDAALVVYLTSAGVRAYFERRRGFYAFSLNQSW